MHTLSVCTMCNVHVYLSRLHIRHLFYICKLCVYITVFSAMWNYCSFAPVSVSPAGCSVTQISEKETVTAALQQHAAGEQWKNGSISGAAERSPETVNDIYQVVICILYYVRSVSLHCNCVERESARHVSDAWKLLPWLPLDNLQSGKATNTAFSDSLSLCQKIF